MPVRRDDGGRGRRAPDRSGSGGPGGLGDHRRGGGAGRILRTLAWAVGIAFALVLLLRPLDAVGTYMGFPPSYHVGARILMAAFWLVGVAAVWTYRPARPPGEPR